MKTWSLAGFTALCLATPNIANSQETGTNAHGEVVPWGSDGKTVSVDREQLPTYERIHSENMQLLAELRQLHSQNLAEFQIALATKCAIDKSMLETQALLGGEIEGIFRYGSFDAMRDFVAKNC